MLSLHSALPLVYAVDIIPSISHVGERRSLFGLRRHLNSSLWLFLECFAPPSALTVLTKVSIIIICPHALLPSQITFVGLPVFLTIVCITHAHCLALCFDDANWTTIASV